MSEARRASIDDVFRTAEDRSLRRLPAIIRSALRLVAQAAPRELVASMVLQVITGVGVAVQLVLGRHVLETVLTADKLGRGVGAVLPSLAALLTISAAVNFANAVRTELQRLLAELVGRHAQEQIIEMATVVDLEAYENPDFHNHLQRAQVSANFRPLNMTTNIMTLTGSAIGVIGLLGALAVLQPLLIPFVVLAYVPVWFAAVRNGRNYHRFGYGMTPADRMRQYLAMALTGKYFAQEIRAFDVAGHLRRRYDGLYDDRIAQVRSLTRARLRRSLGASVASSALLAASIALLVALLLAGHIGVASAMTAAVAIQQLGGRLGAISTSGAQLYEDALFLDDFNSFVELAPAVAAARPTDPAPQGFRILTVDHVSFAYPGTERLALDDVSLQVQAGQIIALVGENGSGKTTLAKLLCNLYTPSAGRILWDGVDTALCDPVAVRTNVAVIFQDFVQYCLTARENIGVGRSDHLDDLEAVTAAAQEAGADGFLADLPHAYETILGRQFDGGEELSIGQWQRVALGRAFFRRAPFVILDEPTAALDPRAEHELFKRIRAMAKGRTVLLISHRFSSVVSADQIFVLDDGRVVEQGPHAQLMAKDGHYASLFNLQAGAYLPAASVKMSDDPPARGAPMNI